MTTLADASDSSFLRLMQLADSALPVGGAAQSFGVESLVADGALSVATLEPFLRSHIRESGRLEAWHCRAAVRLGARAAHSQAVDAEWAALNAQLSAFKTARESRAASLMMGRRLRSLFAQLEGPSAGFPASEGHYSSVFGMCAGWLGVAPQAATLALLQQSLTSMISVCQRLLPLGQTRAMQLSWQLKPALVEAAAQSMSARHVFCCLPLLEIGSMRHPGLATRLFIS